jgi:non-specific serine/threonine protein kinase
MSWRSKLEQLVGLLEKVPQPKSFRSKAGVYEPYFIIELRASNWEIIPYATYTRLDGSPGREVRLSLSIVDSSKVNISQNELDSLLYLDSDAGSNSRCIFNYTQPVGFLLDWLSESKIMIKESAAKEPLKASVHPEVATINITLNKSKGGYYLQPSLVFKNKSVLDIKEPAIVLSSNPIYMLYKHKLYKIESTLPSVFWNNYFRIREPFEIPHSELSDFIRIYLPHILAVLDWENLGEHIQQKTPTLTQKLLYFSEWNHHLQIDVNFKYDQYEFPAQPPADRGFTNEGKSLRIIKRDRKEENSSRKFLEENGLIYRSGHWHIAANYNSLDWMRLVIPKLSKAGFTIVNEEKLQRYRVHRQKPKLQIKVRSGIDWLDLKYSIVLGKETVKIPDLLKQLENDKQYVKLSDGSSLYLPEELIEQLHISAQFLDIKDGYGEIRLPTAGISLLQALQNLAEDVHLDARTTTLVEKYREFESIGAVESPKRLRGELRQYQKHGLDWLCFLHEFNFGGILADDMGLGKTVQVISLLLKLKEENKLPHPVLIVVPLTLIFNWWEEFQKFAPECRVLRYHGNRSDRIKQLKKIPEYDVVLCSYGVVLQDQKSLAGKKFDYIILDESQKIKNPHTKTYKAVGKLRSLHKLALTGTPVENSLIDLWSQINFVNPGLLGNLKLFESHYINIPDESRETQIEALKKIIFPFILRRTKEEVEKELPPLTEIVQYVDMTEEQEKIYHKWLNAYRNEIFNQVEDLGINKARLKIVEALTYLRQIACHPAILDNKVDLSDSGKVQLLEDMLDDLLNEGHKILIFSQFVRFLKLVRGIFETRGWKYEYLDGKVRNRADRIHNFQDNPDISAFLISLKAGGLGLNLTAADYVIHLDPWWNPAVEQQATDRAHRIGQDKRVFVYKYIVKNTVEEKILKLQERKRELSEELITSDTGFVKQLTREDLEVLFSTETNNG